MLKIAGTLFLAIALGGASLAMAEPVTKWTYVGVTGGG